MNVMRVAAAGATAILLAACTGADREPVIDETAENRAIISSLEHVVTASHLSPAGAARLYAYSLAAAAEARREGGPGAAAAAAAHVIAGMIPQGRSIQQTPLPGLAARADAAGAGGDGRAVGDRWLAAAAQDGAAEQTAAFGTDSRLREEPDVVDIAELRARLGLPPEGLDRRRDPIRQLMEHSSLRQVLADDALFAWQPTATGYVSAETPGWGQVDPIGVSGSDLEACRVGSPDREAVLREGLELLYRYDIVDAASWQATVWLGGRGTVTPPGMWIRMAHDAAENTGADALKISAEVAAAVHNAIIIGWDEKYRHNLVRPETLWERLFQQAETNIRDTPAHPSYPSGHSVLSAAAAHVIEQRLGQVPLTLIVPGTLGWDQEDIRFSDSREALRSVSESRVIARFHYPLDTEAGHRIGTCAAEATMNGDRSGQ